MVGDKAAGVGLVVSPETARKLTAWGTCEGSRVIWARLHGVFHDLLVNAIPYHVNPLKTAHLTHSPFTTSTSPHRLQRQQPLTLNTFNIIIDLHQRRHRTLHRNTIHVNLLS